MLEDDDKNSSYASLVYVDAVGDAIDVAGSIDSLLFVLDEDRQYVDSADNETIHVYNAILDARKPPSNLRVRLVSISCTTIIASTATATMRFPLLMWL